MTNCEVLIVVRSIDMELCIDIGAVSTDTLSLHLCVQFLFTKHIINLALDNARGPR
jgi:hypothetical protein